MKKSGHYCKVCGRFRANEKFTGKGHATHICKDCAKLPPEEKAKQETLNRLFNLPWYLSKAQKAWLKNRMQDRRPEVKALAQEQYDTMTCMYFVFYGLGRFLIEGLRTDSLYIISGIRA